MAEPFTVTIPGVPRPMGSKQAFVRGGRAIVVDTNRDTLATWKRDCVAWCAKAKEGTLTGAVLVNLEFRLPRPKHHYGTGRNATQLRAAAPQFPTRTPDIDKLARVLLDALTHAGVIGDDAQVVHLDVWKYYVAHANPAGVYMAVYPLGDE